MTPLLSSDLLPVHQIHSNGDSPELLAGQGPENKAGGGQGLTLRRDLDTSAGPSCFDLVLSQTVT